MSHPAIKEFDTHDQQVAVCMSQWSDRPRSSTHRSRLEYRDATELRATSDRRLEGYAAIFGRRANIGPFTESITPGAFRSSLASGRDIIATVDHDPSRLLARTRSGTLRLNEDDKGLAFDLSVPPTQLGSDLLAMVARGDIGGASFTFRCVDAFWAGKHRELRAVDLLEIAVVQAHPAYVDTSVTARGSAPPSLAGPRLQHLLIDAL